MKNYNSRFLIVDCDGKRLNLTIDVFGSHYGKDMEVLKLGDLRKFDVEVANYVGKLIQLNFDYSKD